MKKTLVLALVVFGIVALATFSYYRNQHPAAASPSPSVSASASPSPSATPSPKPSTSTTAVSACQTKDLNISLDTTGGAAAGTYYQRVILTSHAAATCTVSGFPGVSLIDAKGNQLGMPADRNGTPTPAVTLHPGQAASATVGFPNAGNFDPGTCSAPSKSLKVYPPGQTDALTIALVEQACPGFTVQSLVAR
jgi:hypothetical protein